MIRIIPGLLLYLFVTAVVCTNTQAQDNESDDLQTGFADYLQDALLSDEDEVSVHLRNYYTRHHYQPIWMDDQGLLSRAYTLFRLLQFADRKGLDPDDYELEHIRFTWKKKQADDFDLEVMLTKAFIRYSRHLYQGRLDPHVVDPDWHIYPDTLDIQALLDKLAVYQDLEELLDELEPQHPSYQQLRQQLWRYRKIAEQGGWPLIPDGPTLRPGMRHEQMPLMRSRLRISDDLVSGSLSDSGRYDETLGEAVMRFQARHGIGIDGHIGQQTRATMNVPVHKRIQQILVNMERWRWLPRDLGQRYLLVNITGFELYAEENGEVVLAMPIIIGKKYRATPSFSSKVRYLEINPYWTIPKRIVLEDLIPVQLRQPDYFTRKRIRVFAGWGEDAEEVDISAVPLKKLSKNYFPFRFRQDPGPENSLGRIKFMFPNPYDIYLHDTPHRYLFERRVRTFSSGCIRVADPIRLTAYLLDTPTHTREERVLGLIYRGEHRSLSLLRPIPIYLIYWTAWADRTGNINFRKDIYQRDTLIQASLASISQEGK
jgi:murein L,D-transpeptidase YcbB/YkuD